MTVETHNYPTPAGEITLIRLINNHGAAVTLSSLGAGIIAVEVPDRHGKIENIALSYENPADYLGDGPCMGKIPGRYANRIAKGELEVDGKDYRLAVNCGPHHLHGGPQGFQNKIWNTELLSNGVRFTLFSPDGDENYPGNLRVAAEYRWNDEDDLSLTLHAECDAASVINLTNHTYWNLNGADSGSALDHLLRINAPQWLPTDDTLIPTGEMQPVEGTPMDFLDFHAVGERINADFRPLKIGKGYDHCWVLNPDDESCLLMRDAIVLKSEKSGRSLHIDTDQPGVQIYSGNWLDGCPKNVSGRTYADYDGIAIEAQGLPDAPHQPSFPSQRIDPEHPYTRTIIFRFRTL
ncbi:MAG: galactose mutarotase [Muribaculaceae bacterium]|nr:galactose mutarotase [Muribaculaceae bacterium]